MGKRRANKNRGEDSKRERCEETPDQKNDCKKVIEEKEPEGEKWDIPEIKIRTCTPGAIKDLLSEIGEKYHQFLEGVQVKGHSSNYVKGQSSEGIIAIISPEEALEDELYEQLSYHLRKGQGVRKVIVDTVNKEHGKPREFNIHWNEILVERFKKYKKCKEYKSYGSTVIGELLEEIMKTYEIEQFGRVADRGERIITLLERLKLLLQATYQISDGEIKFWTEKSKYSLEELKIEWEKEGVIITDEAFKDYQELGVTMLDRVTNIDERSSRPVLDLENKEFRVPRDKENVYGNPVYEDDGTEKTEEGIMNIADYLRDRLENRPNTVEEILIMERLLEKLVEVSAKPKGVERVKSFEEFIKVGLQEINWLVNPDEVQHVFMNLDSEEIKVTYKEALENALGRLNANQYSERPDEVARIQEVIGESFNKCIEETRDLGNRVYVRISPDAEGSIEDDEEVDTSSDKDWNLVGKFNILATKIVYNKVQCGKECDEEPMFIELFKISMDEVHKVVSNACVGKDGIQEILPKITEKVEHLGKVVDQTESASKRWDTIATLEEVTRLSHVLQGQVDRLTEVLNEAELGVQYTIQSTGRTMKKLTSAENPNDCHATIIQATLKSIENYRNSQKWSLPKVLRPETCRLIKEVTRALVKHKRYKPALKVSLHFTRLKSMWRASVIMKSTIVRFAELRALEIRSNKGHNVVFTRQDKEDLRQYSQTLKAMTIIDICEVSTTRLNPNPEVMEDVFEKIEEREAEERRKNYNVDGEESSEAWEAYQMQEQELPRELSKLLRRSHPKDFIAMSTAIFKEFPIDFIEHGPTTAAERVEFYESQIERWMKEMPNFEEDSLENKPEDYPGYKLTKEELSVKCHGSDGVESIYKYPGLKDADVEVNMFVIAQVVVPAIDQDSRGRNPFLKNLPKESYGGALQIPGALHYEREISRRRATYLGDSLFQNSTLSKFCIGNLELKETGYSCGMGCKFGDPKCPTGKKQPQRANLFPEAQFDPCKHGTCMQEWCTPAKNHVNLHVARDAFNSASNYNGGGVMAEQLVVVNPENDLHHQVVRLVRLCVLLDKRLAAKAITYTELLSDRPIIVNTHMPESLGDEDVESKTRPVDIMRIGSLHLPRCVANAIYIASNCATGTNATDENIAVAGHTKLHQCKVCCRMFLSPVSLLIHLLYEEEVLGNVNKLEGNHSACGRFAVCKCRLLKRLKKPQTHTEKEDFMYYDSEDIGKVGNRKFELYSLVQLNVVDSIDLSLMELYEFTDLFVLLNQIGLNVFLPGGSFARRWNLYMSTYWRRSYVFGDLFKCMIGKPSGSTHSYLPGDVWKMETHTSIRMSAKGELYEIAAMEAAAELVDGSLSSSTSSERFGSVGNPGLAMKYNATTRGKLRLLEDRSEEELKVLKCFFNFHQEILNMNIVKFCLMMQTTKNKLKTYSRKLQILRTLKQLYQDRAVVDKVIMPALMKIPIGENPFNGDSLYHACYGEVINAMPEYIRNQPFEVNLNEYEGKEIFPGMEFTISVSGTRMMPKAEEVTKLIAKRIKAIGERGWKRIKGKVKGTSIPKAKSEDFRAEPRMSEEVRQKKLAEIKKKIEKENAENVLVLQKKWRCEQCRIAHPTSGKRFPEHRGGCYEKLKSKKDRKVADKEIEKEIEENKEKRIAKEMENLKNDENEVNSGDNMDVEDDEFCEEHEEAGTVDQETVTDIFSNETIRELDEESSGVPRFDPVHVRMRGIGLGKVEPVWRQHSSSPLEPILEERQNSSGEVFDDNAQKEDVEKDTDKIIEEKMLRRTAEQKSSDESIQSMVRALTDTWESEDPIDKVKKEQKELAKSIFLQTRKMAKQDYSLTTFLKKPIEDNSIERTKDSMEEIESASDEENDIDKDLSKELFKENSEIAEAESEEPPRKENADIVDEADYFLSDEVSSNDSAEEDEEDIARDPPEVPNDVWCCGGYDEGCEEYTVCNREGCNRCQM